MANFGFCPISIAGLWGAYYVLLTAWSKGFRQVLLELDSSSTITLIHKEWTNHHPFASVINHIRLLLQRNWVVKIQYIFSEANRVANFMATKSHEVDLGVCFFEVRPAGLGSFFPDDMVGVAFPRLLV